MNRLKLTLRFLWRNKLFTALNILGLAIGISACWMVFKIVHYELSFDRAIPAVEDIHQVVCVKEGEGSESGFAGIPLGLPPLLTDQALDDALIVPIYTQYMERISFPQTAATEALIIEEPDQIIGTKTSYFELLPYEWLAGNVSTAFSDPQSVVLTEKRARSYFPKLDFTEMIGKHFFGDSTQYVVTGIVKNLSFPSSFPAEMFIPIREADWNNHNWLGLNSNHIVFIKSQNSNAIKHLLKVAQEEYNKTAAKEHAKYGAVFQFEVFPLSEKHFTPQYDTQGLASNKKTIYGLMTIGGFLLLLACINYINLSTAQIPQRAKEIGIRKTLGARPWAITGGFLVETFCISLFALLLSWPIVIGFQTVYPAFIPANMQEFQSVWQLSLFLLVLILFITFISGIYPAYLINKVRSIDTLKGKLETKIKGTRINLRKSLIVFQFIIAQFFMVCALIMGKQLDFTLNSDLGFSHQAVVNIAMPYKSYQNSDVNPFLYKQALQKYPEISAVALGHEPLNNNYWGNVYYLQVDTGRIQLQTPRKYIDEDYLDLYKIELLAGKNLQQTDTMRDVLISETTLKELGFKTPEAAIGQILTSHSGINHPIVGVFKDFNQRPLRSKIESLLLASSSSRSQLQMFNIKLPEDSRKWAAAIAIMEKEWKNFYPNAAFDYKFNEERIKNLYETEQRTAKLIDLATIVTVLLSCLGLFGLSTLTAFQRSKEIGIRKVLGASIAGIVSMLSRDFVKLVMLAILIASPIAWWTMSNWLNDFAYRIEIEWWVFLVAGLLASIIAVGTVSYQAIKVAIINPVESLRDE